jgi:hypothetical protein
MSDAASGLAPTPGHVPPELVRDLDFCAPPGADDAGVSGVSRLDLAWDVVVG